jgi:hypothetical protein
VNLCPPILAPRLTRPPKKDLHIPCLIQFAMIFVEVPGLFTRSSVDTCIGRNILLTLSVRQGTGCVVNSLHAVFCQELGPLSSDTAATLAGTCAISDSQGQPQTGKVGCPIAFVITYIPYAE